MNKAARNPLRRMAWSLLLGGLGVAAVILGTGAFVVSKGQSAGPEQAATWPAGAEIAFSRPLGRQPDDDIYGDDDCTVIPQDGQPRSQLVFWDVPMRPDFTGSATVTCRYPAKVVTGPAATIVGITRGPLVIVPLFAACFGVLFHFPQLALFTANRANPLARLFMRMTGGDRLYKRDPFGLDDGADVKRSGRRRRERRQSRRS